jgi:RNA polymerase sigma-70 factor, ECF subfamily
MDKANETALARALLAGEPGAFDQFVAHFQSKVFNYTYLMCGHREDAEEVAQETLLKVFEKIDKLREPEHVRAWVFQIARNECYMKRRKSVFAPSEELSLDQFLPSRTPDGDGRKIEIADWSSLPEDTVLNAELAGELRSAIASLPENYKSVLLLRDVEGLSGEETAQVLEISVDAVKTRLHRARLAVRQQLDSYLRVSEARK